MRTITYGNFCETVMQIANNYSATVFQYRGQGGNIMFCTLRNQTPERINFSNGSTEDVFFLRKDNLSIAIVNDGAFLLTNRNGYPVSLLPMIPASAVHNYPLANPEESLIEYRRRIATIVCKKHENWVGKFLDEHKITDSVRVTSLLKQFVNGDDEAYDLIDKVVSQNCQLSYLWRVIEENA